MTFQYAPKTFQDVLKTPQYAAKTSLDFSAEMATRPDACGGAT